MRKLNDKIDYLFIGGITLILVFGYFVVFTAPETKTKKVSLYFSYNQAQNLKAETRQVETDQLYKNIIQEMLAGPNKKELVKTIPRETRLINAQVKENILILNFNSKLRENHWGGSTGEIMTIYSIVDTMVQFPGIDQVQFLLRGKKVESLVGHVNLEAPIGPNYKLIKE